MQSVGKVGKRLTLYPPKGLLEKRGLKEGNDIIFRIEGEELIVEKVKDPWTLALQTRKWSETTVEEFEKESERIQEEHTPEEN